MVKRKRSTVRRKAKKLGFRSGFEQKIAEQLDEECAVWEYEKDKFHYVKPETEHTYTTDFVAQTKTGLMYIETKGKLTLEDRKKLIFVRDQHNIDLRILFMNANVKLRKGSNTTYSQWAEKNNFLWAHKRIPKNWLKEMVSK
jgi:hypothetical protein